MAWQHLRAATDSDLYDGRGSYKNIMYRICAPIRGEHQQYSGWCTASEKYLAETTGFSERQVQRAVAEFRKDGVFTIRALRKGGKEFNHYKANMQLLEARKRNLEEAVLVSETSPGDMSADGEGSTRQAGVSQDDRASKTTRQSGGVVSRGSEVERDEVDAYLQICKADLRSTNKGYDLAVSSNPLTGRDKGGSAPKPPLCGVEEIHQGYHFCSDDQPRSEPLLPLESAVKAALSREERLADAVGMKPPPPPPSRDKLTTSPTSIRPRTPLQVAEALVEETKTNKWDTYLRGYSLAFQFAGYLEARKAKGEKAYAFDKWQTMYTADFLSALERGWPFKDLEDLIDQAQTTKYRFITCTPRLLFENAESVMKMVYGMRSKGMAIRHKLGEHYSSWYVENAGSVDLQVSREEALEKLEANEVEAEEDRQREIDLDADIPIMSLSTAGKIRCINPDCPYRFDSSQIMRQHFIHCFRKAVEEMPDDPEYIAWQEKEDAHDDRFGVTPCSIYPWFEEDEKAGRWEQYAPKNTDGGVMFDPWQEPCDPEGQD